MIICKNSMNFSFSFEFFYEYFNNSAFQLKQYCKKVDSLQQGWLHPKIKNENYLNKIKHLNQEIVSIIG